MEGKLSLVVRCAGQEYIIVILSSAETHTGCSGVHRANHLNKLVAGLLKSVEYVYLTIILQARVGYEMIDSQRGA